MNRRVPFLFALSAETRAALERLGRPEEFAPGTVLIEEGDRQHELWFLQKGLVKVTRRIDGDAASLVDIKTAGDVVGEVAAMDRGPRSATVTACRAGRARVVPWHELQPFLHDRPDAMSALFQVTGECLRRSDRRRLEFGNYPVPVRLARVLLELSALYGRRDRNSVLIEVNLSQTEFASLTGAHIRSVGEALRNLRRKNLISPAQRWMHIRDLAGLRAAARLSVPPGAAARHLPA